MSDKKYYNTPIPNVQVAVRLAKRKKKSVLVGIAVDKESKKELIGSRPVTRQLDNRKNLERITSEVVTSITREFENYLKSLNQSSDNNLENIYTSIFDNIPEENRKLLCPESWGDSTAHTFLTYIRRNYLTKLNACGLNPSQADMQKIRDELTQSTLESGRMAGDKNAAISSTVYRNIENCNKIYIQLRRFNPLLPDVTIPHNPQVDYVAVEHCKELTLDVRTKFAKCLFSDISNGLASGAVLMFTGMLRTGEAVAPIFKNLDIHDDYVAYAVITQGKNRSTQDHLKTYSSYRMVVMPQYAADFFRLRISQLKEAGYTQEQIDNMPVCSMPKDPTTRATANELSVYVRVLLSDCGCNAEYWEAVIALMEMNPDSDADGHPLRDVGAYALRRDGCSRLCNICNMDPMLVDALMGHILPSRYAKNLHEFVKNPDNWPMIAGQMERCVLDPAHSSHPSCKPIVMGTNGCCLNAPVSKALINIPAEQVGKKLSITICNAMPGEDIQITSLNKPKVKASHTLTTGEVIPVCEDLAKGVNINEIRNEDPEKT